VECSGCCCNRFFSALIHRVPLTLHPPPPHLTVPGRGCVVDQQITVLGLGRTASQHPAAVGGERTRPNLTIHLSALPIDQHPQHAHDRPSPRLSRPLSPSLARCRPPLLQSAPVRSARPALPSHRASSDKHTTDDPRALRISRPLRQPARRTSRGA
jgi:hypothetical protein